ncbi:hypothetical protein C0991_005555, partial [Blastosporella zonata]
PELPEQHATFYSTRLPFLPIVTLDRPGRPWGSILAGSDGKPGFVRNTRYNTLSVDAKLWQGDPLLENSDGYKSDESMLVAGIGVEYSTRRRNKFAGKVANLKRSGNNIHLDLSVNEALGNCPKYITIRDLVPRPNTSPTILHQNLNLGLNERLPDDVVSFILDSDTVFLGTTYTAPVEEASHYPSHVGMNQRGGRKGNRYMTSLGNIEASHLASLTFVCFTSGTVLYLTGAATNLFGVAAQRLMPMHSQNALTTTYITGFTLVADALPVRQRPGTTPTPSPYSPPVRFLAEESGGGTRIEEATALLTRIEIHSPTLATFTWAPSEKLTIIPGQAVIMDFTPLIGAKAYQHMAPGHPTSVNDDRIRTWTVSSTSTDGTYCLTMRRKPGGLVTGALFNIARKLQEVRPALLEDARPISLTVRLVGITGEFVLPKAPANKLLWLAGGIGLTPFIAMLQGLDPALEYDIRLVLSTREPEILVPLLKKALLSRSTNRGKFLIEVFSEKEVPELGAEVGGVVLHRYGGRVTMEVLTAASQKTLDNGRDDDIREREIYLCGPEAFEEAVLDILVNLGVEKGKVMREGFGY